MGCKYKLILFDFDYTLADSSKGVISCINYALENMGLERVSEEAACRTIGLSLKNTFFKLYGENDADKVNEFAHLFIKHADEVMTNLTQLYSSVPETVALLKGNGIKVGIISGKFRYRIEDILRRADLLHKFDIIIGGEDVTEQKPNPEGLIKAIAHFKVKPEEVLYIGDSITDAETTQNTGVIFTATLTGVTTKSEFMKYNVHRYINDISELAALFNEDEMDAVI